VALVGHRQNPLAIERMGRKLPTSTRNLSVGDPMNEERKYAIPFAATLLCARKLQELDSDRPSPAKIAAVENESAERHSSLTELTGSGRPSDLSMALSFGEVLIEVWRQALIENVKFIRLGSETYPVRRTSKRRLRQVDFVFEGEEIRGLEQNPLTKSQWALMARSGKKVMQFLQSGRYVANVVDGKVKIYGASG